MRQKLFHRTKSVNQTIEHETCCLAFTATSNRLLTNKITTSRSTTVPRRMKCRPRARCITPRPFQTCAGVKSANTSSGKGKSTQGSDRGTSPRRRRVLAEASAWVISVSNLIDNSFLGPKDSPGALHCKLGALAFSASSREFPSARSGLNWQLSPGQRPEVVRRGPIAVSTMFAGFKEPTKNGHAKVRKQPLP